MYPNHAKAIDSIACDSKPISSDSMRSFLWWDLILFIRLVFLDPPPQTIISASECLFLVIAFTIDKAVNSDKVAKISSWEFLSKSLLRISILNNSLPVDFGKGILKNLLFRSLLSSFLTTVPLEAFEPFLS